MASTYSVIRYLLERMVAEHEEYIIILVMEHILLADHSGLCICCLRCALYSCPAVIVLFFR